MKNLESYFDERYSNTNDYRAKKKDLCIQILNGITDSAKSYKILDIVCGSGFYTSQMVKQNREVTGTDISQIAIDQLPKEIKRIRSDVSMKLPFDDNSFEVIMLMDILELIPDLQLFKNELKRITKKDAIIIGCVPNANFYSI